MPPIVPLTTGEPLVSIEPVFEKPLPVIVYVTELSVTPGAAVRFTPMVPTASPWLPGSSLEHASGAAVPAANTQTKGTLPSHETSPDLPRGCFIRLRSLSWEVV